MTRRIDLKKESRMGARRHVTVAPGARPDIIELERRVGSVVSIATLEGKGPSP